MYISNPPSKRSSTLVLLSVTFIPPTVITGGFTGKPIRIYPKHKKTNNNANTARENIALYVRFLALKKDLTGIAIIIPPRAAAPEPIMLINFSTISTVITILKIYKNISPIFILLVSV